MPMPTAVGVTFFQTKMLVAGESIKPKFNRISPLQGFKRLFSLYLFFVRLAAFWVLPFRFWSRRPRSDPPFVSRISF